MIRIPVSILLAVYNGASTLHSAVESLRQQTLRQWELILVDDGSTDTTASVATELGALDPRIRVVTNDRNLGLAESLNRAFRMSSGEFIARMDADDRSLPERFMLQLDFLRTHPDVAVLGTAAHEIDSSGRRIGLTTRREHHDVIAAHMFKENPFIHPSVMLRREFLEALAGYDQTLRRAQDYDLWLRGYQSFRYHNLPEPLLEYRRPRAPTWSSCSAGARVLWRAGVRESHPVLGAWGAARLLSFYALSKAGLRTLSGPRKEAPRQRW